VIVIFESIAGILIILQWVHWFFDLNWLWLLLFLWSTNFGTIKNGWRKSFGIFNRVASWSDSSGIAPRAYSIGIASTFRGKSTASLLIITQENHGNVFLLFSFGSLKMSSFWALNFDLKDTNFTFLHWWPVELLLSFVVVHLGDVLDVLTFLHGPEGHKDNEDESAARFLTESLSGIGFVSPEHPLSTLANGHNLTEEEESDHSQGFDGVIYLEFISRDVLRFFISVDDL
jgi:hypothetical protein